MRRISERTYRRYKVPVVPRGGFRALGPQRSASTSRWGRLHSLSAVVRWRHQAASGERMLTAGSACDWHSGAAGRWRVRVIGRMLWAEMAGKFAGYRALDPHHGAGFGQRIGHKARGTDSCCDSAGWRSRGRPREEEAVARWPWGQRAVERALCQLCDLQRRSVGSRTETDAGAPARARIEPTGRTPAGSGERRRHGAEQFVLAVGARRHDRRLGDGHRCPGCGGLAPFRRGDACTCGPVEGRPGISSAARPGSEQRNS